MSLQAKPASAGLCRNTPIITAGKVSEQASKKPVLSFLYRVYPANWFIEFSDISITLEEFAPAKTGQKNSTKSF